MKLSQSIKIAISNTKDFSGFTSETMQTLDRMEAFNGRPALRFIMATAIRNGSMKIFTEQGEWNDTAKKEVERFITHTGFQKHLAETVFYAVAAALNWELSESQLYDTDSSSGATESGDEKSAYAQKTAIEINREKEPYRGVSVDSAEISNHETDRFTINATLRRTKPMGSCELYYAAFDSEGKLTTSGIAATMPVTSPSVMPVTAYVRCKRRPASITLYIN